MEIDASKNGTPPLLLAQSLLKPAPVSKRLEVYHDSRSLGKAEPTRETTVRLARDLEFLRTKARAFLFARQVTCEGSQLVND